MTRSTGRVKAETIRQPKISSDQTFEEIIAATDWIEKMQDEARKEVPNA